MKTLSDERRFTDIFIAIPENNAILHLVVNGTCHDVARGKRETRVVFLHEFLAVHSTEYATVAAHCFRNQERRTVTRMIKGGGVELYKFHIFHRTFGEEK